MKANFFEFEYNPKVDYLITKNLLFNWPGNFNEFELRKVYKKHIGHVNKKLKVLQNIRDFLSKKKIIRFTKNDYEKLIYIITGKKFDYHFITKFEDMNKDRLSDFINFLNYLDDEEINYTALSIMLLYVSAKENEIIIPYRGMVKKMFYDNNSSSCLSLLAILKERTSKKNIKHDKRTNELVRRLIKDKKNEFLDTFKSVKEYGIFGSFAMHKENEYSDLDMVVISEDTSFVLQRDIYEYWKKYFDLEIDIKLVKEDELETELTDCMKMTLKMVR